MLVTIAINTWNRSRLLDGTLAHLARLDVPAGVRVEVVVVDNNSTDNTRAVVEGHAGRLPVRYIFEPKQGTSFAKNAAVEAAGGELTLWTDDDVQVSPGWLRAYLTAAEEHPQASYFGGVVRPWYESRRPPAWFAAHLDRLGSLLALVDLGPDPKPLDAVSVIGANMAFRTAAMKGYRFRTDLGDVGGKLRKGEESDLVDRMQADGHRGVWVPGAAVEHHVPADRLTARYVWRYYVALGRAEALHHGYQDGPRMFGAPRYLLRAAAGNLASAAVLACRRKDWVPNFLTAAVKVGTINEIRAGLPPTGRGMSQ